MRRDPRVRMTEEPQDVGCRASGGHGTRWAHRKHGCVCPAALEDYRRNNSAARPSHALRRERRLLAARTVRPDVVALVIAGLRETAAPNRCEVRAAFEQLDDRGLRAYRIADILKISRRHVERLRQLRREGRGPWGPDAPSSVT